jgi:hypothetical protein
MESELSIHYGQMIEIHYFKKKEKRDGDRGGTLALLW